MFNTHFSKRLSDFTHLGLQVVRDGEFFAIGKAEADGTRLAVPLWNRDYVEDACANPSVCAIITSADIVEAIPERYPVAIAAAPLVAAMQIHEALNDTPDYYWTSFPTRIAASAQVHPSAVISERDVVIGENVVIGPNTVIEPRTLIEDNVFIGPNCSIGCIAFESYKVNGAHRVLPQAGGTRIGLNSVIMANTCLVRSAFASGWTELGEACIIDNLVHIAHDVKLGAGSRVGACGEVSGRVVVGEGSYIAPTASVINGLTLGRGTYVTMGSMVTRNVPDGARVTGYFAEDHATFMARLKERAKAAPPGTKGA